MAALAATDVAYTINKQSKTEDGRQSNSVTVVFGDGALTYPAGGIPLTRGKYGCPVVTEQITLIDPSSGDTNLYKVDLSNEKIRIYKEGAAVYAELSGAFAAITLKLHVVGY